MLKIKASVRPDQYGGVGLFADEFIPKGTLIWEESPLSSRFVNVKEYFDLPEAEKPEYERYSYPVFFIHETPPRIGLIYCTDDARYVNHSAQPNSGEIDERQAHYAFKDIHKDEEITCNYLVDDPDDVLHAIGVKSCKLFLIAPKK